MNYHNYVGHGFLIWGNSSFASAGNIMAMVGAMNSSASGTISNPYVNNISGNSVSIIKAYKENGDYVFEIYVSSYCNYVIESYDPIVAEVI